MKKYVKLFEEFITPLNEINYELDRHSRDFRNSTIEFNVKNPNYPDLESVMEVYDEVQTLEDYEELIEYEIMDGSLVNQYSTIIFELLTALRYKYIELIDWSFAGRSNGWFVIEYTTIYDEDEEDENVIYEDIDKIEDIVDKAFRGFPKAFITYLRDGELTMANLPIILDNQTIVEWAIKNNIDIGLSDDVKNIAGAAMKGNHKLK